MLDRNNSQQLYKNAFERGLDVIMPNVAVLGVVLFSVCIIVMLLVSINCFGWAFLVVSKAMAVVIGVVNPMRSRPVKLMILSSVPVNSSFVSLASLKFKNLIDNHWSQTIQGGPSKKQSTGRFHEDHQDIKEPVRNNSSILEITQINQKQYLKSMQLRQNV